MLRLLRGESLDSLARETSQAATITRSISREDKRAPGHRAPVELACLAGDRRTSLAATSYD